MKKGLKDIQVIILAGGRSERLWPLADKNTFLFLGKPLISHQIEKVKKAGFEKVVVVCNQKNIQLIKNFSVKAILQKGKGQAAAILSAQKFIRGKRTLILNANDLFEGKLLRDLCQLIKDEKLDGCLTGWKTKHYFPGGYLIIDKGLVKGIMEKPGEGREPSNLVRIVADYFSNGSKLIESIRKTKSKRNDLYEWAINQMIEDGASFKVLKYHGSWGYLKYPWHVLIMMDYFLDKIKKKSIAKNVQIAKGVTLLGPVKIEKGVKILENAKIIGPVYIGEETIIGNNSLIRQSMIDRNSIIGFGTEIVRSYIGKNCWFHSNYVGDSVLEENVSMGAGTVLANLRLDERNIFSNVNQEKIDTKKDKLGSIIGKNVRIGVNASIMPGIKIGKDSFVSAGVLLNKDLPENTFCLLKQKQVFRKNLIKISSSREKFRKNLR